VVANPQQFLKDMFTASVEAADPMLCVPRHLPDTSGYNRVVVVGAGKAAASMAEAAEKHLTGPFEGLVITRYGYTAPCEKIEVVEAAHPVPDKAGADAAQRMIDLVSELGEGDLVIALVSGGGSSLLSAPAPGLTLEDKQAVNRELLRCGANIREMNTVRRHISAIKGGRLAAAAHPAKVHAIMISDIPGDDMGAIASGPTVADPTTFDDAMEIVTRYKLNLPASVMKHLQAGVDESPKPGDPALSNVTNVLAATPLQSLQAAADFARKNGVEPIILSDAIEGESSEAGKVLSGVALSVKAHGLPVSAPAVILSGGETTVTIKGDGSGGPNAELTLSAALTLQGEAGIWVMACDTDGVDGAREIAGAIAGPDTLAKAEAKGLSARKALANNDAHNFFEALGDGVVTGPTHTNVNDLRAFLVLPS